MINVMVVEDHQLIRSALVKLLANVSGIQVIAETDGGEDAVRIAQEKSPHVVLMDLKLPGMGGLEATREILQQNSTIKIIILTACSHDPWPRTLLQAGASGYLTKGASVEEMINAIRTVYAGKHYISPLIAQKLAMQDLLPLEELSEREQQVMTMITNGSSVQDIAKQLNINPKTVNTYRYRLYEKLEVQSDVELTLFAIRYGLLKVESE